MPLVTRGGYAFISYRSALDFVVSTQYTDDNGETNLHVAFGIFFDGGNAWAFPKVSRQFINSLGSHIHICGSQQLARFVRQHE